MDKVLLIDFQNQLYRASVGFAPVKKNIEPDENVWIDNGQPFFTDVPSIEQPPEEDKPDYTITFNFFRNLRPIVELFQPNKIFVCLDGHSKFRYELFPAYKANRKIVKTAEKQEERDRLYIQKDIILSLMKHLPITCCFAADYEADDIIGTLAKSMSEEEVVILSGDTDFIQLLQIGLKNIRIYNPISNKFYESPSWSYVAWKSLVGDKSDSIPGFKGIGDKKAQKLLSDPDKFLEFMNVEENRSLFSIYRSLIELQDVPIEDILFEEGQRNWDELKSEFEKMAFNSMTNDRSWEKYIRTFDCVKY